jgi:hypothetical protein
VTNIIDFAQVSRSHTPNKYLQDTWKKQLDSNISDNVDTVTNFDETTEEKKENLDDSLSNSSFGK